MAGAGLPTVNDGKAMRIFLQTWDANRPVNIRSIELTMMALIRLGIAGGPHGLSNKGIAEHSESILAL